MFSKIKAKILPAKDFDVVKGKDRMVCYKSVVRKRYAEIKCENLVNELST